MAFFVALKSIGRKILNYSRERKELELLIFKS